MHPISPLLSFPEKDEHTYPLIIRLHIQKEGRGGKKVSKKWKKNNEGEGKEVDTGSSTLDTDTSCFPSAKPWWNKQKGKKNRFLHLSFRFYAGVSFPFAEVTSILAEDWASGAPSLCMFVASSSRSATVEDRLPEFFFCARFVRTT